ncbi:MAG: transposase, partial [Promethearchaeota archaeon]
PDIPICLVMDGHSAHRAHIVTQWIATQPNFFCYRLPKNSPELNPIEYFWKQLRQQVTHKKCYKTVQALKMAISRFFSYCWEKSQVLRAWLLALAENIWRNDNIIIQVG